ncbi:MAG TPA: DUF885 family protein, partial [Gemmatimonadaceae bacterium]|nr:DUF885 family protein [Gemmatimonadaceae bacterium]
MPRTHHFVFLSFLAAACQPPAASAPVPASIADPAKYVTSIADDYLAALRETVPEINTTQGIPGARHDRLTDNSAAAERGWQSKEDEFLARLKRINPNSLIGRSEWVTYGLLREELESSIAMRACNFRVWNVSPMTGLLASYVPLAQQQPVGTDDLRRQAVTRWRGFPHLVDMEIANLREGVRAGYTEPKVNVTRVIEGADRLLAASGSASPLYSPAQRDTALEFDDVYGRLVTDLLTPAVRRYRDFLANEYLPAARDNVSITANPNGAACNAASIRRYTTLDLSPDEVYNLGQQLVARAESTMRVITVARFGTSDVRAAMRQARTDSTA